MPRDHGRILCSIWRDPSFKARSPEAQRLFMLLVSQDTINNAGVLPLTVVKWANCSAGTTVDDVQTALEELCTYRFTVVDSDTQECLVRSLIRNDGVLKQPNVLRNALREAERVESPQLRRVLAAELRRVLAEGLIEVPPHRQAELAETTARTVELLDPQGQPPPPPNPSRRLNEGFGKANGSLPEGFKPAVENPSGRVQTRRRETPREGSAPARACDAGAGAGEGVGAGVEEPTGFSAGGSSGNVPGARDNDPPTDTAKPPGERPPERCARHAADPNPPACRHCATARQAAEDWDEHAEIERQRAEDLARSAAARQAAHDRQQATQACGMCDDDGRLDGGQLCHHDPAAADVARRGSQQVRSALAAARAHRTSTELESESDEQREAS